MCVSFPPATPGLGLRYPETQNEHQATDRESSKRSLPVLVQGIGKASPNAQRGYHGNLMVSVLFKRKDACVSPYLVLICYFSEISSKLTN